MATNANQLAKSGKFGDLRRRLVFLVLALVVYRIGAHIPVPGIDPAQLQDWQPYFEKFNRRWIEKYFVMEPVDEWVLTNPEEALLKPGGAILMATCDGEIAGTVALRNVEDGVFEFTKMAVDEKFRRLGIAESLSLASFAKAR